MYNHYIDADYPNKYKFLNSGGIMGYRDDIYRLIMTNSVIQSVNDYAKVIMDRDDDQLFYTKKYLNEIENTTNSHDTQHTQHIQDIQDTLDDTICAICTNTIVLDTNCEIFQTINGCSDDLIIHKNRIYNKYTNSYPIFIHGNGPTKSYLNNYENYIENYIEPLQNMRYISNKNYTDYTENKKVFFAIYINSKVWNDQSNSNYNYNYNVFLKSFAKIDYPNKIVYVYDRHNLNDNIVETLNQLGCEYVYKPNIREYVFRDFYTSGCQYYFLLDEKCCITKVDIIYELLTYIDDNAYRIICPMLVSKSSDLRCNFWGALDDNGFYRRSHDYIDIVKYNKRGIWNMPYIYGAILFHRNILIEWNLLKKNKFTVDHIDMALCYNIRRETLFSYLVNNNYYGYMI